MAGVGGGSADIAAPDTSVTRGESGNPVSTAGADPGAGPQGGVGAAGADAGGSGADASGSGM